MLTGLNVHLWHVNVYLKGRNIMQNRPEHNAKEEMQK